MGLLLAHSPLTGTHSYSHFTLHLLIFSLASLVNAIFMFVVILPSVPAIFMRTNRRWLVLHSWGIVITTSITLGIGLRTWYDTLETHRTFGLVWNSQEDFSQSLLQHRFKCCGYTNPSLFIRDQTCPAQLGPCRVPFGNFANEFLDVVFTTVFGFCAVDVLLMLATMCLIIDRKERERFRKIDIKLGGMQVL